MIIFKNFEKGTWECEQSRNGSSHLTTWKPVLDHVYLKDVSFGVVTHPFKVETSFRRKPLSPLKLAHQGKGADYGIAVKGTPISSIEWQELYGEHNPVPLAIRRLWSKYGERFYRAYPSMWKHFRDTDSMELATQSESLSGTNSVASNRQFPSVRSMGSTIHFIPNKVKGMSIPFATSTHFQVLFDESQSVRTWQQWHEAYEQSWNQVVLSRAAA